MTLTEKNKLIHEKGFDMTAHEVDDPISFRNPIDFSKIKIGLKTLQDATLNLGSYKKINKRLGDKETVLRAINDCDYDTMCEVSDFFYRTSGIYQRLCRYMAYMYRYDWVVTPFINSDNMKEKEDKVLEGFHKALNYLDNFEPKRFFGEVALKVIRHGSYYGYLIPVAGRMAVQELPPRYCRSRFTTASGMPVVEFNMKYFDDNFRDPVQRLKILNLFPPQFKKGYILYKEGKLQPQFKGDTAGWFLLEVDNVIKFNINGQDFPAFISVIPAIIELDQVNDLQKQKMQQQLLKIIVQKLPIDKNGDLVFDVDEAQQLHNNAVMMLSKAIGINVLTTFADVSVEDMADSSNETGTDDLEKAKAAVYDQAGVSQMQFNTDGNMALEKSVLNDQASLYNLIQQFQAFLNKLLKPFNTKPKKVSYRAQILMTTIYNYKEMAKLYKEQTQLGYSKMLPQIALGQAQSSVLATAYFENDILDLVNVFIPPLSSNVMNGDVLMQRKENKNNKSVTNENGAGRPEKEDDQKSQKTIQNRESMS